jgi:pimeloyl-ACP methyl ester carboxylesterase
MPTIQSGEHTIYYRRSQPADAPNAPPLVLIHGAGGTHMHWPGELRRLPATTVYALDLPGHGQSPGAGLTTIADYTQAVMAWADAVGLPHFVLAGHSMGGAIAQTAALRQPERLAGLILVGTGARLGVAPAILAGLGQDYAATARLIAEWAYRRGTDSTTLDAYAAAMLATPVQVTHDDFAACNAFDVTSEVSQIALPTLVIVGLEDRLTPPKYSRFLAQEIPAARLLQAPEAGHMVMLEQSDLVAAAVREFVASL